MNVGTEFIFNNHKRRFIGGWNDGHVLIENVDRSMGFEFSDLTEHDIQVWNVLNPLGITFDPKARLQWVHSDNLPFYLLPHLIEQLKNELDV